MTRKRRKPKPAAKPLTVNQLRGLRARLTMALRDCEDGATITLEYGTGCKLQRALDEYIAVEAELTGENVDAPHHYSAESYGQGR